MPPIPRDQVGPNAHLTKAFLPFPQKSFTGEYPLHLQPAEGRKMFDRLAHGAENGGHGKDSPVGKKEKERTGWESERQKQALERNGKGARRKIY